MDAIKHSLAAEIKSILYARQTCLKSKEYLVKYKGCHHKEVMWMKPIHMDHLLETMNKFQQESESQIRNEENLKEKKDPFTNGLNVHECINPPKWGRMPTK
jgi:hypothetical protein